MTSHLLHLQKQIEVAKKEWELEHLQAKKEAEERKNAAEEDDMFFTYARDETYDQVHSPKSSSNHTTMNKLKMRIARVIPNGNSKSHEKPLSYEVVGTNDGLNKKVEDFVDVTDDGRSGQDSPVYLRSSRLSRKDSVEKEGLPHKKAYTRQSRLSRQSSRSNSRSSSRSSSKNRVIASPAHSPRYRRSTSKT